MSEELTVETNKFIAKKLKDAQEASNHGRSWCKRNPKHWALVAQHIIQKPSEVNTFLRKNNIKRNFYYDVQTELLADPESSEIRNAWASEISSVLFQGLDTYRKSQNSYSDRVESGDIEIDGNELFKQGKSLQAFNDIHSKLTGNNIQRHVVEHKTTLDEAEEYARKMLEDLPEAEIVD